MAGQVNQIFLQGFFWLLLCLVIIPTAYASSVTDKPTDRNSDSVVNERIPVNAEALEKHWQINCKLTLEQAQNYLQSETPVPETHQQISEDLEKCGYIYNTSGSLHYQAEPNYLLLREKVDNLHN